MPTADEIIIINAQLVSARSAYHSLMTGKAPKVIVDQNGERVEYVQANASRLWAYIQALQNSLNNTRVMGPMRVYF